MVKKAKQRKDHRPIDGIPLNKQSKSGYGEKFTWEGPRNAREYEYHDLPVAIDENDPNFVDEGEGVAGEVDVVKVANEGVEEGVAAEVDLAKVDVVGEVDLAKVDVVDRVLQENM
ncbi:hypothetical protein BC332_22853 [Capsicum chinense]|nr:hypothetical protein BC332_22853 [Capsicum chinense]